MKGKGLQGPERSEACIAEAEGPVPFLFCLLLLGLPSFSVHRREARAGKVRPPRFSSAISVAGVEAEVSMAFATRFYDFLMEVNELKAELAVFSAQNAQCFCCSNRHLNPATGERLSCDRALVNASIAHWHLGCSGRIFLRPLLLHLLALQRSHEESCRVAGCSLKCKSRISCWIGDPSSIASILNSLSKHDSLGSTPLPKGIQHDLTSRAARGSKVWR